MTTQSQCIFPPEIICHILSHASPVDVVRWRRVSKWFCDVSHDPTLWRNLYTNEPYIRPPGPFSTLAFERAFVKSAKLAQTWTTRDLQTLSRVAVPFKGEVTGSIDLIDGRWFFVCQADRRFVLYDTSVGGTREPQVIWEQKQMIYDWSKRLATSDQGKCVVYVLMNTAGDSQTTLLEIQLNAGTGAPCGTASFELPEVVEHPELDSIWKEWGPCSRFLALRHDDFVFDRRTRAFYGFPVFRIARPATRFMIGLTDHHYSLGIIPTNTHVIHLYEFNTGGESFVVIQAFIVPDNQDPAENKKGILRLTHEGVFEYTEFIFALIRNSVVNPATGDVNVKLLGHYVQRTYDHLESVCIGLTLESTSEDVSPIFVRKDPVLVRHAAPPSLRQQSFCAAYYDISQDGYARGLLTQCVRCTGTMSACKFSIDATRDECVVIVSQISRKEEVEVIAPLMDHRTACENRMGLDSVRGKLSYLQKGDDSGDDKGACVCVVDVK